MADSGFGKLLLLGGAGVAAYYLFLKPSSSAAQASGTPQQPAAGTAAQPQTAPAKPPVAYNTLDQMYQRLVQALQANNVPQQQGQYTATLDQFNYYLGQVGPNLDAGGMTAAFGQQYGSGGVQVTFPQFWGPASAWLQQNKGLTGIGGRGLAGIIASRRR